ncbi:heterochromatin protein 1-like [Hydra vulgaris]|uniref:heterochromatin protein 1-like n=1 Tax=Hydra vulgaris TaxID=6087 RepID=UPI000640CECB|nr:heterochromatin protein 1-like [Hydra vulgaris]
MNNKEMPTQIHVSRFKQWFGYEEKPTTDLALNTEVLTEATETLDEFCFEETNHKIQKEVNLAPETEHQVDRMENLDSDIYKTEKIIKKRTRGGKIQYLIKWEGYPSSQNTWEPEENIFDPQVIQKYINSKKTSKSVHISAITTTNLCIRKKKNQTNCRVMPKVTRE